MPKTKGPRRVSTALNAWMITCMSAACVLAVLVIIQAYQKYMG